jgi:RHS repeat-associated protein
LAGEPSNADLEAFDANPLRYRGYYYDQETGYYYLQSRYYDPTICRFINADLPQYAQKSKNSELCLNIYIYCSNDPVDFIDFDGFDKKIKNVPKSKKVGWGIQIELTAAFVCTSITVGVELIWFTKDFHKQKKTAPYVYLYMGGNLGAAGGESTITKKVDKLIKNLFKKSPKSFKDIANIFSFSVSICAFMVRGFTESKYGFKKFKNVKDYKGPFMQASGTLFHIKFYAALGSNCYAFGAGFDTSKFNLSSGESVYSLLNDFKKPLSELKKVAKRKAK